MTAFAGRRDTRSGEACHEMHRHTAIHALHEDTNQHDRHDDAADAPRDTTNGFADPVDGYDSVPGEDGSPGLGLDVNVRYNPGVSVAGIRSDVVLAHELEHAHHQTQGTPRSGGWGRGPTPSPGTR